MMGIARFPQGAVPWDNWRTRRAAMCCGTANLSGETHSQGLQPHGQSCQLTPHGQRERITQEVPQPGERTNLGDSGNIEFALACAVNLRSL
jgi:hypothetical protein